MLIAREDDEEEFEDLFDDIFEEEEEKNDEEEQEESDGDEETESEEDGSTSGSGEESEEDEEGESKSKSNEETEAVKTARDRVRAKIAAELADKERLEREYERTNFSKEDFESAMQFDFPDIKVKVDEEDVSLKEIASENPEIAALLKYALGVKSKEISSRVSEVSEKVTMREYWEVVEDVHPGARKLKNNDEFTTWLSDQDDDIKTLAGSADPEDVVVMLDAWKATQKPEKKEETPELKKKKKLMKKSSSGGSKKPMTPDTNTDDISSEEFEKLWGVE